MMRPKSERIQAALEGPAIRYVEVYSTASKGSQPVEVKLLGWNGATNETYGGAFPIGDDDAACVGIIQNQFGRRNLAPFTRVELTEKLKPLIAGRAKANLVLAGKTAGRGKPFQKSEKAITPIDTQKELAKLAGVSHDTITWWQICHQSVSAKTRDQAPSGTQGGCVVGGDGTERRRQEIRIAR